MITESTRQGFYILFIFLLLFVNEWLNWMSYFEAFVIIALAGIVIKLTDIQEAIKNK